MIRLTLAVLTLGLSQLLIRTHAGRDHQARVVADSSSDGTGAYAPASWMAVSASTSPPDPVETGLTGEITSGPMARAQGVYAHTTGSNVFTVTRQIVSDRTVTLAKVALFNAETGGTMAYVDLLAQTADLHSGDQVQVTYAVNI